MTRSEYNHHHDEKWMSMALNLAHEAEAHSEVPVGAVIVIQGDIIAAGYNRPISQCDPTAHAEIVALREAGTKLGNYRFPDASIYVTLEPCAMCLAAMLHARLARLCYAVAEPKTGACGSVIDLLNMGYLGHHIQVESGILAKQSQTLLQSFFQRRRHAP